MENTVFFELPRDRVTLCLWQGFQRHDVFILISVKSTISQELKESLLCLLELVPFTTWQQKEKQ